MNEARGFALILTAILIAIALAYSGPGSVDVLSLFVFLGVLPLVALFSLGILRATMPNPAARAGTFLAVALLGLHPSNAQSLSNPGDTRLLFALLGIVLGFVLYQRKYTGWLQWIYLVPTAVAALCHEAALVFAPFLFIYKLLIEESPSWRTVPRKLALCGPAAVVSLLVFVEPGGPLGALTISTDGMIRALITLVSPEGGLTGVFPPLANVSAIVILAAAAVYASLRVETRPLAFGLSWFLAMLFVVPEHFLPAYVGVTLIIAWFIAKSVAILHGTRPWLVLASCAILLAACGTTVTQKSGSQSSAAGNPSGSPSFDSLVQPNMTAEQWLNLSLYAYQGKRYLESLAAAQTALRLKPDYADAFNNMAASYSALHQWDFAIASAQEALRINPNYTLARNNLNWALEQKRLATH